MIINEIITEDSDHEIRNYKKLDKILVKLCKMVVNGQKANPDMYGVVAAAVLDTDNRVIAGLNTAHNATDTRKHAERVAIEKYQAAHGDIPKGSIIITTCSPCSEEMAERFGDSCTQLINAVGLKKVYCGFIDPSQEEENRDFNIMETENQYIRDLCKTFAKEFLDDSALTEAFDKPYAFNWSRGDHGDYDVFVKLPDGSPLNIAFNQEGDDGWHVAFDRGHSQEITGEGDAQRIFATVLHAIQQFIGKEHPDKVYFSASKDVEPGQNSESRANLYSRMVKRYASALGYDSVIDDFGRDSVTYILNKKQGVAEDTNDMNFEQGDCPIFAIALHRLSKLPLMALVEYDDEMGSAVLIHAYVKLNDKWRIDATGETDVDWMLQKYPNNGAAEEIEISERDLIKLGYGKNKCPTLQQVLPHAKEVLQDIELNENFADGRVKGKSRPGRVKRAGASCNGSVTDLRARARKASGERAKMYHWCANMKSGRNK